MTLRDKALRARLRVAPGRVHRASASRARRAGLTRRHLILSFDCDTQEDIDAAVDVHARLLDVGVVPAYAVPGALLRQGADVYRRLAETGSEFLNHGGREHTYFDHEKGRYASCFFYDEIGSDRVREDIEAGHEAVREVLGVAPQGFRTPHFGTYQEPDQLRFLHSVLSDLGYRYSTSTVPEYGLRYGPAFNRFGLPEVPVSGMASAPLEVLDSWSCFAAPDRTRTPDDFRAEAMALAHALAGGGPGVINIYADPSHVLERVEFFDAVEALRGVAEPSGYGQLLEELR
jgi:hypothetical protein